MHASYMSDFNVFGQRYIGDTVWMLDSKALGALEDRHNNFRMNIFVICLM